MNIFFDLDGTIFENKYKYYYIYKQLLSNCGCFYLPMKTYWKLKRNKTSEMNIFCQTSGKDISEILCETRLKMIENLEFIKLDRLQPQVHTTLRKLSSIAHLYLVTMRKNRKTLMKQLDYFSLKKYFKKILSQDDNNGKANVKIELIKSESDYTSKTDFFIGDTELDIKTGKFLGLNTIAVTCGIRATNLLRKEVTDHIFPSIKNIPIKLFSMNANN
jgi:phosphoglycolate phosphatase-like HAD superfamily hydrolase